MQASEHYHLFGDICLLGLIAFMACLEAYRAHKKADNALYGARGSETAHLRLDRIQRSASVSHRETMAVSYTDGFSPRDSWVDDFRRTQVLPKPAVKLSLFKRLIRWMLY